MSLSAEPAEAPSGGADGFVYLPGYFTRPEQEALVETLRAVIAQAPLYTPLMPRTGRPMSVRMTNMGALGWYTDREKGYRYEPRHPFTDAPWPPIPPVLVDLWDALTMGAPQPEACLVNWYEPHARMGLHVDGDEDAVDVPVVSVSLGDDARFRIGGRARTDKTRSLILRSGDVAVLGGAVRQAYHGIDRIMAGTSDLLSGPGRINLTLRRVTVNTR
jgi:DNA oxidative demethylase